MQTDYQGHMPHVEEALPEVLMRIVTELHDVAYLIERVKGFIQLTYSFIIGYGLFLTLIYANRRQIGRLFFGLCVILVIGCLLERTVPAFQALSDAVRVKIYDAFQAGDFATAMTEQERLFRLFSIVYAGTPGRMGFTASALGAFKTALMLRGIIATNIPGRPLMTLNDEEVGRVREGLVAAGLL